MSQKRFAVARREELWIDGAMIESRLTHGLAILERDVFVTSDAADRSLLARCDDLMVRARRSVSAAEVTQVRIVADASTEGDTAALTLMHEGLSLLTDPQNFETDQRLLLQLASAQPTTSIPDPCSLPILWRNGTSAVLMHEAVAHPVERRAKSIRWPEWLRVRDGEIDLLQDDSQMVMRRSSFSDVPIPRMREVVVEGMTAPCELPAQRIEVLLVEGGHYDPLSDRVSVRVSAAESVDGRERTRVEPFVFAMSRAEVARSVRCAGREVVRYPGVVCSSEGQEMVVGSRGIDLLTLGR